MGIETDNNNGQNTDDTNKVADQQPASTTDNLEADPILSKHLDIAIEAQDGKKSDATAKSAEPQEKADDKAAGSKDAKADSTGDKTDATAQSKPDEKGKEAKGDTRGPKDLVLKGQGPDGTDLVIKGGPERRFYEQLQTARQRTNHLENEVKSRDTRLQELQTKFDAMNNSVQQINGMPPAQLAAATRLFTDLQRDPSGTLKKLLAEAVALGHTVEGIGQGIDVEAIKAAIRSELATKETVKEPTQEEIANEAQREVDNFYGRFPDARTHDALLGAVLRDHPDLTLEAAYFQLKDAFAEKGFDWSRTIEDNVNDASGAAPQEKDTTNNQQKPLPNGTGEVSGNEPIEKHKDVVMSENSDMGDIVKAAMRESGMNV